MSNRVITSPIGRLSFPSLFEPKGFNGSDPKFQTIVIFEEGEALDELKEMIEAKMIEKFGKIPPIWNNPIKAGETKLTKDGDVRPEFAGRLFITCKSKEDDAPAIVNEQVEPVTNPSEVYGGCKARVLLAPYAYDVGGNKGVSLYLKGVQLVAGGEPFGVAVNPLDGFTKI